MSDPASPLSPTAKVILGLLRAEPMSGYEIKQLVDRSTRFFWTASFGSIYPELKRLSEAELVAGTEAADGDRRQILYELTDAGERSLTEWERSDPAPLELRDEALLQFFFAAEPELAAEAMEAKAIDHAAQHARLQEIAPEAASKERPTPLRALQFGLDLHEFCREWCEREAERLRSDADSVRSEPAEPAEAPKD